MRKAIAIGMFILVVSAAVIVFAGTLLFGTVGLKDSSGKFCPGQIIRIYLVSKAIKVPHLDSKHLSKLPRLEQIVAINNAQLAFFKSFREQAPNHGFIVAETVSSRQGTFTFKNVPAGRYFLVVTFPSMIMGRKVAWQVPVDLTGSGYNFVHLDSANLALPVVVRKGYQ